MAPILQRPFRAWSLCQEVAESYLAESCITSASKNAHVNTTDSAASNDVAQQPCREHACIRLPGEAVADLSGFGSSYLCPWHL